MSLGLKQTVSDLRSISSSVKSAKTKVRKYNKIDYSCFTLRRSSRLSKPSLKFKSEQSPEGLSTNISDFKTNLIDYLLKEVFSQYLEEEENGPANAPLLSLKGVTLSPSPVALARRCTSKGRGSVYDPSLGICCHFCRFISELFIQ